MSDRPWYSAGLRFSCTQCGNCCRAEGQYAYIYVREPEVEALAAHLGLPLEEFRARHCAEDEGWTIIRADEPACPFLGEDARCTVYEARPMQCRTWPFWDENLKQPNWEGAVRARCPGIGTGPLHSAEEIEATARMNEEWYDADD